MEDGWQGVSLLRQTSHIYKKKKEEKPQQKILISWERSLESFVYKSVVFDPNCKHYECYILGVYISFCAGFYQILYSRPGKCDALLKILTKIT